MAEVRLALRHKRALAAFEEEQKTLRWCDLPYSVGMNTMRELVGLGLIEVADPRVGPYSKLYAWRLLAEPVVAAKNVSA